jgi:UMF1 family MFS transporter
VSAPETAEQATNWREVRGWYFYDFANSAFSSTVVTLLLGPYLSSLAAAAAGPDGLVHPLGVPVDPRSWWSYTLSVSVIAQVLALPVVGALSDATAKKKQILALFAYIGAAATFGLFFVHGTAYFAGGLLFLIANVAFGSSIVVYNAFLPLIAKPHERDDVSSRGWGIGYLGGGVALALNLALFANAGSLGITEAMAARINLGSVGVWWAAFTLVPLAALRNRPVSRATAARDGIANAFRQLARTLAGMRRYPRTLLFLAAYLLYNDAVQAVIALSGQFGADELKIPMSTLALAILMVQFVAFAGALVFNYVARWIGAKPAILVSLLIWTAALAWIYFSVRTATEFFMLAAVIALVLGGTQALSRSLFSLMIPKGREAEYFSFYEISDKGTSWMAPLFFGLALQFTHSYRLAVLSLIVFFAAGFILLARVDVRQAAADAAAVR